jgi:hypothetical protein
MKPLLARLPGAAAWPVLALALCSAGLGHDDGQHGRPGGHLPASHRNVELVGKLRLTNVDNGIADVGALGNHAYLAAFHPECDGLPGAQGAGVHVVDISNPADPKKVAFIPAPANSYPGEGIHVLHLATPHFTGDVLLHNNETCDFGQPSPGGISVWDVTDPANPVFLAHTGDPTPGVPGQTFHTTHSVQGWTTGAKAYAVASDNDETIVGDLDVFDISDPRNPVLISERGLVDWPAAQFPLDHGQAVFAHDMQVNRVGTDWLMLVSYWDAGHILLNVNNPAAPVFIEDSDHPSPDSLSGHSPPEGNAHQAFWSADRKFVLASDEDFGPIRTLFKITTGPHTGPYGAAEPGWTVPIPVNFPAGLAGPTIFGGSAAPADLNGNGTNDLAEVPPASALPAAPGEAKIVVFSRGAVSFVDKVQAAVDAGYDAVIIANSHEGSLHGLLPDRFVHAQANLPALMPIPMISTGHRVMHLLFKDPPSYGEPNETAPDADLPPIGTVGEKIFARREFDGWGYLRLLDGRTLEQIDAYSVPEGQDPAYAAGFGALTIHEVKTDPREKVDLAYVSHYAAGLRVVRFGRDGLREVGHYIAEGGNDFWGVFPLLHGQGLKNDRDRGRGRHNEKRPLLLMSDRDSGLWIFRYTGQE